MGDTAYTNLSEINDLQEEIMIIITEWVHKQKTTVPQKHIIMTLEKKGVRYFTTVNALNALIKKGYIRKNTYVSNTTSYVQLRTV